MPRMLLATVLAALATVLVAPSAAAEPAPATGGCAAFGQNVALLGRTLGGEFGENASTAATLAPRAFPTLVVFPEQKRFCGTKP